MMAKASKVFHAGGRAVASMGNRSLGRLRRRKVFSSDGELLGLLFLAVKAEVSCNARVVLAKGSVSLQDCGGAENLPRSVGGLLPALWVDSSNIPSQETGDFPLAMCSAVNAV